MFILSGLAAIHTPFASAVLRGCSNRVSQARVPSLEFRVQLYLSIRPDTRVQGHALPAARHQSALGDSLRPGRQRGGVWVHHALSDHGLQTYVHVVRVFLCELSGNKFAHGD